MERTDPLPATRTYICKLCGRRWSMRLEPLPGETIANYESEHGPWQDSRKLKVMCQDCYIGWCVDLASAVQARFD